MYVTSTMPLIHREGLLKLINDGIEEIPATHQKICPNKIRSKQSYEEIQTHAGLGFFVNMDEAEGITYDAVIPRYTKQYTPIVRTLGVKHTRQSLQKDLYSFVKSQAPMLAKSAVATKNLLAANVLNFGFGLGSTSPDGSNLFASSHPLINGTDSNLISLGLSGLALETAIQTAMAHKGDRGIPKYYQGGFYLFVGTPLAGLAVRAAESNGLQGTADNDTNKFNSGMIKGVIVDQLLGFGQAALANYWYLIPAAAADNPLFEMEVAGIQVDSDYDMDFQVTKFGSSFECIFDNFGWRGLLGSSAS